MKRNIVLIGSMGSGKSHIGRHLAQAFDWQFVDTDRLLEEQYGAPIAELYQRFGEKEFRYRERQILKRVSLYHEAIISVGGNFTMDGKTVRRLQRYSFVVLLTANEQRLVSRVKRRIGKRPTMNYDNVDSFVRNMIVSWRPLYKRCDTLLDTTYGDSDIFVERIQADIAKKGVQFKKRRREKVDG